MTDTFAQNKTSLLSSQDAQQPLLKSGALQSAIFNSANFSCIATDAHGVIQIYNVGAERMLGYKAEDVIDKITPADISDVQELTARAGSLSAELGTPIAPGFESLVFKASRGIEDIYDLTYIRKDGTRFPALVSVTALRDLQENIIGYLLIGTDNTERKKIETEQLLLDQQLREQQQSLEKSNRELTEARAVADKANLAKTEFLSSMSHELRTPLNAVLGFAQLMESATPLPTPAQKLSIEQILKGGWYLLQLINEILDLATIESGKVMLAQEVMSLTDVLQDCEIMIEPQASGRGIRMTFHQNCDLLYVIADPTRVKQAIINLLSNAIKYNRADGSVVVRCGTNEDFVRVSVSDTGAGLSADQVAQLFQPFNRLGQANGKEEGTGIGLVMTKQLVELMGGRVGVESEVDVGSVFWIELPISSAPQSIVSNDVSKVPPESNPDAQIHPNLPRTLLYIEDNLANLALVEQLIARRSDLKLLTALDAHVGIQLTQSKQPELIIMDINLPGLSGFDAMKILRKDPATSHIPIIALTANAEPRDIDKGLEAGFFDYLTKPIKFNEFMEAVDVALKHAAEHGAKARPLK